MKIFTKIAAFAVVALALVAGASAADAAFTRYLTIGSTGTDVAELQTILESNGYLVMPAGVAKGTFGPLTKNAVMKWQAAVGLPATGYFGPMSIAKIGMGSTSTGSTGSTSDSSSSLKGGAGDLANIELKTSGTETTVGEGKTEKVLGMELEADDNSDLAITSVKVMADVGTDGSTRLTRYASEVDVYMGDKKVGSMDTADFSRTGGEHNGTISLKNAVIKKGEKARFYVALVGNDTIDTDDQDNTIDVSVERVRFEDATGVTTSDDSLSGDAVTVNFEDSAQNDGAKVQSSSATPDSQILKVDDNSTSDDYQVFTFKIKTDSDSSDIDVLKIPVTLDVYNASTTSINTEDFINDIYVMVGGTKYDDYDTPSNTSIAADSNEDVVYNFNIDEGDLTINGGDTEEVKVYVQFGEQDKKYASAGSQITASVAGSDIEAENSNGDNVDLTGTVTGKTMTASISAATIENYVWNTSKSSNNSTGAITFKFTVTADDEDFDVLAASIASTTSGSATTSAGTLTKVSGDATAISGGYTVASGDTATFQVSYNITGPGTAAVTVTSAAGQEVPSNKQYSGLESF